MKSNISKLIIAALFISVGCQKLDRDIVTTVSTDQFQTTYSLVSGLLASVYAVLPDGTVYINGNAMYASATDEAEFTTDPHPVQLFNTGSWNAINNPDAGNSGNSIANSTIWAQYYRGIRLADQLIAAVPNVNSDYYKLDPSANGQLNYTARVAELKRWTYEARFLRAFFYFELVKRYGGVPLLNQALPIDADISQIKRNSLNDCINFISNECDSAAVQLPPYPPLPAGYTTTTDLGRITKYAALALKSRVLLYAASDLFNTPSWAAGYANPELISLPNTVDRNTRWKAASDAAKACIDAVGISSLGTAYKAIFNTNNNSEILFARNSSASNNFEKINSPIGFPSGQSGNTPTQDLVDAYEVRQGTGAAAISVPFDWNNPTHVANIYNFSLTAAVARDPRLGATVITNASDPANPALSTSSSVTNGITFGTPARFVQTFTGGLDGLPKINATKTGYYLRKYQFESLNITAGQTAVHNWIYFRIPEIFLNYAEALNEWSPGNADINKYVNIVRSRTGVAMPPITPGSQDIIRAKIRNERRVELAFEDHRAWDTRRWMIAPATLGADIHGVTITQGSPGSFSYLVNKVESRVFTPKMYLYPLPQSELNISPNLLQNPLW